MLNILRRGQQKRSARGTCESAIARNIATDDLSNIIRGRVIRNGDNTCDDVRY